MADADALGEDYNCVFTDANTAAEDVAAEFKSVMETNLLVYLGLALGCFLSCMSGPFLFCRWLSIPFHWLFGLFIHLYAIAIVYLVSNSDGGKYCLENGTDGVKADAEFL